MPEDDECACVLTPEEEQAVIDTAEDKAINAEPPFIDPDKAPAGGGLTSPPAPAAPAGAQLARLRGICYYQAGPRCDPTGISMCWADRCSGRSSTPTRVAVAGRFCWVVRPRSRVEGAAALCNGQRDGTITIGNRYRDKLTCHSHLWGCA